MVQGAVSGYVLTALPGWTASPRFGWRTSLFFAGLWLAALASLLVPGKAPSLAGALPGLALTAVASWRFARSGQWARAGILPLLLLLVAGWASLRAAPVPPVLADPETMVLVLAGLVGLIGGRALPAFARFWSAEAPTSDPLPAWAPVPHRLPASLPAILLLALAAALKTSGHDAASGGTLCLAGLAFLLQSATWPWRTALHYPSLALLFLSWLWLPAGLLLTGTGLMLPNPPVEPLDALHALTVGAISTMIYGFMARPAMARIEGRLRLGIRLGTGYGLMTLAALARVFQPGAEAAPSPLAASAVLMASGWALFLAAYLPTLARPSPRPVFSAAHPPRSGA